MAVNNFPSTAGGGQPNMDYIKSVRMTSAAITWNRSGSAGTYAVFSSSASSGYAYFVGTSTTGVPLNKIVTVNHPFTSIQVVGIPNDILNLYKVAVDPNISTYADPSQAYYQWYDNSLVTAKVEQFGGTGTYTLPVFAMPIADVELHAGGGSGYQHGGGGGAGGSIYVSLFPVPANTAYSVGAGGQPNNSYGGNTTFGSLTALGGAPGHQDYNARSGGCGSGAGKSGSSQSKSGGSATQTVPSGGRTNIGVGHNGGSVDNAANHASGGGGGGGGAGGNSSGDVAGSGGTGYLSPINGIIYSPGGHGSNHNNNSIGGVPSGHGNAGSGGGSQPNSGMAGQNGIVIVRSYG